jgi:hypothetical protein
MFRPRSEALASPGQFGPDTWRTGTHFRTDVARDQANDALTISRQQSFTRIEVSSRQRIDPQAPIGISRSIKL